MPDHDPSLSIVMYIDGGSRGNPGPAAYAVVAKTAGGKRLTAFSQYLGQATNNRAEYEGLLAALGYALERHHRKVKVFSDSELLVRQVMGSYKVKSADLKPLHSRARQMIGQLEGFSIEHVARQRNREADRLLNQALDGAGGEKRRPGPARSGILRAPATYEHGALKLHRELPLAEGEEVDVEIQRRS